MYLSASHSRIHSQNKGNFPCFFISMPGGFSKHLSPLPLSEKSMARHKSKIQVSCQQLHLVLVASLQLFLIHLHIFMFEIIFSALFLLPFPPLLLPFFLSLLFFFCSLSTCCCHVNIYISKLRDFSESCNQEP